MEDETHTHKHTDIHTHTESHVNPLHTVHASDSPELVRELLVPMEI